MTLFRYFLAKHIWRSDTGNWFDDMYKQLLRIFRQEGREAVRKHLQSTEERTSPRPHTENTED